MFLSIHTCPPQVCFSPKPFPPSFSLLLQTRISFTSLIHHHRTVGSESIVFLLQVLRVSQVLQINLFFPLSSHNPLFPSFLLRRLPPPHVGFFTLRGYLSLQVTELLYVSAFLLLPCLPLYASLPVLPLLLQLLSISHSSDTRNKVTVFAQNQPL